VDRCRHSLQPRAASPAAGSDRLVPPDDHLVTDPLRRRRALLFTA